MKTSLPNPMLWLKKSKTNNFEDNSKSDKNSLGKILFVILLLCTLPTLSFALDLKGNISKDSTITLSQSPCNITADVVILSGATLTFEPGVIVNFMNAGYEIYVGSSASSLGKLNANGATFNGYGPVNVDELIVFRFNSTGTLNNCTFNNVSVVMNESSPTLTNNTFDNCVYPVEFQNECTPAISNLNILTTVTNKGIKLNGTVNTNWTLNNYGYPYFITAALTVNAGATFTIADNNIINTTGAFALSVGTATTSLGTLNANLVTFNGVTTGTTDQIAFKFGSTGKITNSTFTAYDITCSVSSPEIKNNTFNNAFISLTESSPTIQDNTFDNVAYPVLFIDECSPVLTNLNMLNGVTNRGIRLTGTVNTNWTLQNYGYPYFVSAALTVNAGGTFTIADNNIINTTGAFALSVGTATTSLGTLNANLVTFNGVTSGTTDQIAFKFGSTGKITNCTFTAYDITCSVSSPEIKNNTFDNAFISLTESSPIIQNNTFDNVTYPVLFIDECSPVLSNLNMLSGVTNRGIRLTGTVNKDWTLQNYGYPYFITASITVNTGATFTIADNTVINTTGAFTLSVGTATTSLGTVNANLVTFNGVTSGTTDQIAFKFGSTGKITNCTFTAYDITCSISSPEIKNNSFDNAFISLTESSPTIQDNTFDNVPYPVLFIDECSPVLTNLNMMNGVTNRGIRLTGTVNKDWTLQNYGYPYFITAAISVNTGATFTIAENDTINFTGAYAINIGTAASSLGTLNANKVIFKGITTSTADQIAFKFGSTGKVTNSSFTAADLICSISSPEIQNNTFDNAFISLTESSPTIQDNTFDNVAYPVLFIDECSPVLTNLNMMNGVANRGIRLTGTVNNDWTLQNYGYPYFITSAMSVNAGATFTIAENDTINFTGAYAINIGTSASSLGTLNANKVIFKGVTNSTTDQIAFKFGSTGKVTNSSFTAADLVCSISNPEIQNNTFDNAFISLTESSPTIQDNTFDNVAYPVLFIDECSPVLTNLNMMNGVTNRGIRLYGTVNKDWTLLNYSYPYFITGTISVNSGATFTIAENDSINFTGGYAINIGSSASSLGNLNANKVIFKGVTNSTADQIAFKFGSTGKVTNSSFTAADLVCSISNPEIQNNTFDNAFISLTESSPTIQDNTFDNVAYPVLFIDECSPVLTNLNMLNGVTNHGIRLTGTVNKDWTLQNYSYPYFMTNTLTVNAGAIFTIAKGDTIKIVAGYALAAGTSSTSLGTILADSVIFQGVTNTTSDQLAFRFGSTGRITNCSFTAIDITSTISSPEIRNNSFNNAFISLNESSAEINDNTFDNVTYPVEFVNECTPTITNLIFGSVTYPGIKISGTINSDWTLQNYSYPYYMPTTLTVNTGATFTSAPGNTIFFNGVNLAVGSSTTSIGKFYAKANSFRNLRTTDNIIYFRYGAEGVLDSCDFIGIRIHTDASNPRITRSKFHKSQNAFYTANNANPEILNNIFYNNTLALKNAGTNTITAKNNYWGHKSGPMHPNNPNGIGEKIEGLVDFSDFSEKPVYGNTVYSISTNTLAYDSIPVGNFQDKVITLKSFGDIDLLFADILTPDPSFLIQIPANKRAWIEKDDSLNFTVRFKPQEPIEYDINAFVRTNNIDESEIPLHLTGNGLPILKITPDSISFDSVYYGNTHIQYIKIENVSSSNSIMVDSIVNTNHKFLIYKTITPALSKIKAETETAEVAEATETRIITNGFSVSKTTPAYIAVQYLPYQSLNDEDEISIYYNAGALHKIKVKSSTYADELSTKVISLDARQFPNIYMNVQVDTFAVSHNGLTEKDIEVYENGVLQTEGFKVIPPGQGSNTRLTDIVFMMDNSGSMSDEQAQVRNNVSNFVSNLSNKGIDYAIGLCRYGASENAGNPIIEDNGALSLDYQYFRDVVWNRNVVSGGTEPGYYAIMQSASNFKFRSGSQKIFIIITDETPQQGSIGKLQLAIEACINQKITLYAFTMTDLFHLFTPITNVTNGRVFNITSSFDLILDYISNMVTNNYVIQYTSSEPVLNGVRRNVEVKVKYKNIEASDTTSYVPGAIPKITRTSPTLQLHNKAWEPGTQLTIEVEVKDDIEPFVNSVTLYCRTTKTSTYTAIQMTSTDNVLYRGTIPASLVLEPGVEYYITATDGVTSSDAPSIDAINNPYQIAVLPNTAPVIEHTPVTEGYFRNDILIHALVTDNTNFVSSVELYYRKSGQLVFNKHTLTHTGNNNYETNISGRYSTLEDIEYYIKATDDFGVSSFSGLPESPHSIKMQNASGLEINKNVNNIHIYPNPVTNGRFIISLDNTDFAQNFRITLMNATGMKLAEIHNEFLPIGSNKIPVQVKDVNSGIYFIEITTETGVYYRKLVVE